MAHLPIPLGAPAPAQTPPILLRVTAVNDRGDSPQGFRYMLDFTHLRKDGKIISGWLQTDFPFAVGDGFAIFDQGGKTYIRYPRPHPDPKTVRQGGVMAFVGRLFPVHPVIAEEQTMNELTTTIQPLTMSSREIAELVGSRHDKVKQSIERLAERGVITLPPLGETSFIDTAGKTQWVKEYHLVKRDSLVVVAQLCPEFTARIVDRWQELEEKIATPQHQLIPQTLPEALRLAADLAEQKNKAEAQCLIMEAKIDEQAPKVAALERIAAHSEGAVSLREAAKISQVPEKQFLQFIHAEGLIFRNHGSSRWQGYAEHVKARRVEHKLTRIERGDGTERVMEQVLVTPTGLTWIAQRLARQGTMQLAA